jgi:hypothetical protein
MLPGGAQAWITAITAPSGFLSSQVMVPRLLKGQEVYQVQIRFIFILDLSYLMKEFALIYILHFRP